MKTIKITEGEIAPLRVSALPSRPTAPTSFGGKGYTATQMKEAFDRLPLLIIKRLNSLIDDINDEENGITLNIPTGIKADHTLRDLFEDILTGEIGNYLAVHGNSLAGYLSRLREELDTVEKSMGSAFTGEVVYEIDGGRPQELGDTTGGDTNG